MLDALQSWRARIVHAYRTLGFFLPIALCIPAVAQPFTFTTDEDFQSGFKINVQGVEVGDGELQINTEPEPLPYIWVACSRRGTIVRIATSTFDPLTGQTVEPGDVLGEYWSSPDQCRPTFLEDPKGLSRTTVDFDGNVWAGNRHDVNFQGHVAKIGSGSGESRLTCHVTGAYSPLHRSGLAERNEVDGGAS